MSAIAVACKRAKSDLMQLVGGQFQLWYNQSERVRAASLDLATGQVPDERKKDGVASRANNGLDTRLCKVRGAASESRERATPCVAISPASPASPAETLDMGTERRRRRY